MTEQDKARAFDKILAMTHRGYVVTFGYAPEARNYVVGCTVYTDTEYKYCRTQVINEREVLYGNWGAVFTHVLEVLRRTLWRHNPRDKGTESEP